jgi:hypothetical protein
VRDAQIFRPNETIQIAVDLSEVNVDNLNNIGRETIVRYWRKNGSTMKQYISYSLTSRKPMIQLEASIVQYSHTIWGTRETS